MNERVVVERPGGSDMLKVVREAEPVPQAGQVKIRILASGVAFGDVLLRKGIGVSASSFPLTPGYDFVGVVEERGAGSVTFALGDMVAGLPIHGGYQRFICVAEDDLIPVPPDLSPNEVVSVMLNYTTAYQLLTRAAKLQSGDTALFHGAAGGVGTAMLQLVTLRGIKMYGTVSSGKVNLVSQLGGIPIDYTRSDFVPQMNVFEPHGVQAVFDPIGGRQLRRSYEVVSKKGTLVFFGASSATQANGNPALALAATFARFLFLKLRPDGKRAVLYLIDSSRKKRPQQFQQDVQSLFGLLQEGKIKPQIAQVLPLRAARQAHDLLEVGGVTGKIILQPNGDS